MENEEVQAVPKLKSARGGEGISCDSGRILDGYTLRGGGRQQARIGTEEDRRKSLDCQQDSELNSVQGTEGVPQNEPLGLVNVAALDIQDPEVNDQVLGKL